MDFKNTISIALKEYISQLTNQKEQKEDIEKNIEVPPKPELGDFAFPCFILSKELKKNPAEIAKEVAQQLHIENIKITATGPYINFFINNQDIIKKTITEVLTKKETYGSETKKQETIIIDYSGPNVAKNMGIHNLRSTIIGQALYNIHKLLGYNTIGINHLGDWGTQFGKLIWALEAWSNPEELKEKGILFLNELYVKFHNYAETNKEVEEEARVWFKKIEDNDKRAKMWWKLFVEISLTDYQKIYNRFNINFDETKGESEYIQYLDETINTLKQANLVEESEGALVVNFQNKEQLKENKTKKEIKELEDMPPCLLKKSDGATLYGTRDLAAALYRLKTYKPNKILYCVDIAQSLHFKQVFTTLELLDQKNKDIFEHIQFGRLSFPDGSMSTRKGNIVPLKEVLDKAKQKALETITEKNPELTNKENVAEMIGSGAIIFGDLSHDRIHNITFEWDKVLDFQGETAPYIQYTVARINSILRKAETKITDIDIKNIDFSKITQDDEKQIAKLISTYNQVLNDAAKSRKPHHIAKFCITLAQLFNSYYVNNQIMQEEKQTQYARIALVTSIKITIENALHLLGINTPEEM